MIFLRFAIFLLFTSSVFFAQLGQQNQTASLPENAEMLVQSLYTQVVSRHPIGIPKGENMKTFAPFLSETLRHRIDFAVACGADWYRQNPGPNLKPAFGWLELGFFSGDDEQATPSAFAVERVQVEKDGSKRVYLRLTYEEPGQRPLIWHVAAIALKENGQYVVDDIIYLKQRGQNADARLSDRLSTGCNGPHWVGFKVK